MCAMLKSRMSNVGGISPIPFGKKIHTHTHKTHKIKVILYTDTYGPIMCLLCIFLLI